MQSRLDLHLARDPIEQSIGIFTRSNSEALTELVARRNGLGEVHATVQSALAADISELLHVLQNLGDISGGGDAGLGPRRSLGDGGEGDAKG